MNRAVSAALLSALVFPGAGHLFLRRPRRACLFIVPTLVAAFVYFGDMATRVSSMVDQVLAGRVAPDPAAIAARLDAQGAAPLVTLCGFVLLACWVGSIIDSFVVARTSAPRAVR
jgi:hypothetical protein